MGSSALTGELDWLDEEEPVKPPARDLPAVRTKSKKRKSAELTTALRRLTMRQRFYLKLLLESMTVKEADNKLRMAGWRGNRTTLWRWRAMPKFVEAMELARNDQFERSGISKEKVMLDAEKIREEALTPKPILYKGEATGFEEVELGAALRALELQGKGVGISDLDQSRVQVNIDIDFSGRAEGLDFDGECETLSVE